MHLPLRRHPGQLCTAVTELAVAVAQPRADCLELSYTVIGKISDIDLPSATTPVRTDELWRHSCFEAFIRTSEDDGYYEFNFAPSTCWAAYRFAGYRDGMTVASEIGAPVIEVQSTPDRYLLRATLALAFLSALPDTARRRLGLSAVIKETNGRVSYWALAHPPGRPDFHHADGFVYELPPPQNIIAKSAT